MAEAPMEEVSFKVSFLYSGNKTTSLPPHRRNTKLRPLHHSGNKTTSLPPHRSNREFTQRRRRRQRERQKRNRFRQAKQQLCTCITLFLYISLPSLHDYNVKLPNFTFCRGREQKTTTFFFFSWTLMQSFRIQLQKNLPTFAGQIKGDGTSAIKFEAA